MVAYPPFKRYGELYMVSTRINYELQKAKCSKCEEWLDFKAFNPSKRTVLQNYCIACYRVILNDWYTKNKRVGHKRLPKPLNEIYVVTANGCHERKSRNVNSNPYPKINGKLLTHIVYEATHGPLPKGTILRHNCDNPFCFNLEHLLTGSHADNVADRVKRNRSAIGEGNGRSKLTVNQVIEIIADTTTSTIILARKYDVNSKVIKNIRDGITWKSVPRKQAGVC